jgi:cytochrome c oxidase subunit 2
MPIVVQAVSQDDFNKWMDEQKVKLAESANSADREWSKPELMAKGVEVYKVQCLVCHQDKGQGLPPAFPALTGSPVKN